jgi:xanthine dehydrogenase YagS FAD-binding subunit
MLPEFAYIRPKTVDEAVRRLAESGAVAHAGGTDLLGCMREHIFDVKTVVSLSGLPGLRGIKEGADGGLMIGALTTLTEIAENPAIQKRFTALSDAANAAASPQLRNQGTLGGNLGQKPRCWYYRGEFDCLRKGGDFCYAINGENAFHCIFGGDNMCYIVHPSDPAPALAALKAEARIIGPEGSRTMPVGELHVRPASDPTRETWLEPGELIVAIQIPAPADGTKSAYRKVRARRSWDFALAGGAFVLTMDGDTVKDARVVLSGVATVPWRSEPVEKAIIGKALNEETISAAAEAAVEGAEPLSQNGYKVPLLKGVVREELEKMAG